MSQFHLLGSAEKRVQDRSTSVSDDRAMNGTIMNDFPTNAQRLRPNADTVYCTHFQSGAVKVQLGDEKSLTRAEKGALHSLESGGSARRNTDVFISYAE